MDLSSVIAGVSFRVGLMNASGALCVTQAELEALGESDAGAIVTKSMTPLPREGNPHPRYVAIEAGSINSMGLPNLGYPAYAKLIPELKRFKKPVIASLAGLHPDDFLKGAKALNAAGPDLVEVNLSCPNIPGKPQIGYDFDETERLLCAIRDIFSIPFGVKLPPYFDPIHHQKIAEVLQRIGVAFITVINSVGNTLVVDPEQERVVIKPKGGFGGLGGRIIKPVALANVRAFWMIWGDQIPIIGTGGVENGTDIFEHVLCGASAVQIGTILVEEGVGVFTRLAREVTECLERKGYSSLMACRGKLQEID
jgi:dihydroorotate dehydrogenase (fumarate)